jgi:hypothetical protein
MNTAPPVPRVVKLLAFHGQDGSRVLFQGVEDGRRVIVAVDPQAALGFMDALAQGEEPVAPIEDGHLPTRVPIA